MRAIGTKYTDANGIIHLDHLKEGWYRFTEVEAPAGYQLDEPSTQEIYLKGDDNAELTFKDTPLSAIIVMKKDGVNGKALPGATFQLRYLGGTSGTGGTVIGEKVTDQNGVCSWTGLKAGTYIVEEVKPAPGYNIVEGPKTVYISGKAQDVITVSFDNSPDGTLLIKKVDAKNPTKVLAGAKFRVQYTNGTLLGNDNGIFTTDENGQITIAGLEPKKTIIVTEIEAPAGYIIDGQAQTIDIKSGQGRFHHLQERAQGRTGHRKDRCPLPASCSPALSSSSVSPTVLRSAQMATSITTSLSSPALCPLTAIS